MGGDFYTAFLSIILGGSQQSGKLIGLCEVSRTLLNNSRVSYLGFRGNLFLAVHRRRASMVLIDDIV